MNKISVLIPARGGSKSVPHKNIKEVGGYPLIAYSIQAALECSLVKRVTVSTDCDKMAAVAREYGASVPFKRPDQISQDNSVCYDNIIHYLNHFEDDEEVVYFRPTTPLRDIKVMENIIKRYFLNKESCSSLRSTQLSSQPPYKMFKMDSEGYCEGFFGDFNGIKDYSNLPRQVFPQTYLPNGYLDICKRKTLVEEKSTFGKKILMHVTEGVIDVDTQAEFDLLDFQLSTKGHKLWNSLNQKYRKRK